VSNFLEGDDENLNDAFKQEVILEEQDLHEQNVIMDKFKKINPDKISAQDF
jgi:hypothetical protein